MVVASTGPGGVAAGAQAQSSRAHDGRLRPRVPHAGGHGHLSAQPHARLRDFDHWVTVSGLPRITLHGLRHTSATTLVNIGVPLTVVFERLGHAKTSITMDLYAHTHKGQHANAADLLGAAIGPIGAVKHPTVG